MAIVIDTETNRYGSLKRSKQNKLISGENIKTINGQSVLGSGNLSVDGHFKGWWPDLATLEAAHTATEGDSAYVKDASPATTWSIYVYDATAITDNNWADSGTDADTSKVQNFASGEEVNEVHIINDLATGGEHDVLSAKQGLIIGNNLNMLGVPFSMRRGYVNNYGGIISMPDSLNYLYCMFKIDATKTYLVYHPTSVNVAGYYASYLDASKQVVGSRFSLTPNTWMEITPNEIPSGAVYFAMNVRWNAESMDVPNGCSFVVKSSLLNRLLSFGSDGSITTAMLQNGAVSEEKISPSLKDKLLSTIPSINLYDSSKRIDGKLINNTGAISSATGWAITDYIPVVAGHYYYISCSYNARTEGISWFNSAKNLLNTAHPGIIMGLHQAPENAAYVVFNVAANGNYSTNVMIHEGQTAVDYVPFGAQIQTYQIKDFQQGVTNVLSSLSSGVKLEKSGNNIVVRSGTNNISAAIATQPTAPYGGNHTFNFTSWNYNGVTVYNNDDIAPVHAYNTKIGANHGQPCILATITSHGLDNTVIGTEWIQNGIKFYPMRIVNENQIVFLSENRGSLTSPSFTKLQTGTLVKGADTLTVSTVSDIQLHPAVKNNSVKIYADTKEVIDDGTYYAEHIDIVETYEIMNPASTLNNIIARAGTSADPEYDGEAGIIVKNTYRFTGNLNVLVISEVVPLATIAFGDIMFSQASQIGANGTVKYYVPSSLPLGNGQYDMRQPLTMTWNNSVPTINITSSVMADQNNHVVNRVLQYRSGCGFALGFLPVGVGANLLDYTNTTFELRNDTGKVYPHGVDTKIGSQLTLGNAYTAVLYRSYFVQETDGNRLSMYHFNYNGAEYVYVDYKGTMIDTVVVSDALNGKQIEVVESVNTQLLTNVYNQGLMVNATYQSDETCFIVLKIY